MSAEISDRPVVELIYKTYGRVEKKRFDNLVAMKRGALELIAYGTGVPLSGAQDSHLVWDQEDFFNFWHRERRSYGK